MGSDYGWSSTRDLGGKGQLGGVIFGTKKMTINECLSKQLFGLPSQHFSYVKKIELGLPLFLFNYTDRTLLGIYEAASSGQMNIDPYAWTGDGSQRTPYPAQVQIRVRMQCKMLTENQFKPIIIDNYYSQNMFWFELDHAQTNRLLTLLSSQALTVPHVTLSPCRILPSENKHVCSMPLEAVGASSVRSKSLPNNIREDKPYNVINEKDYFCMKLKELALKRNLVGPSSDRHENYEPAAVNGTTVERNGSSSSSEKTENSSANLSDDHSVIAQLVEKVEDLMVSRTVQNGKIKHLEQKIVSLEQDLDEAKTEIKNLKSISSNSETSVACQEFDDFKGQEIGSVTESLADDSILLVGGYDGMSWLSSLDCYSPSQIQTKSLKPMNTERCNAGVSKLDGEIFVFGGGTHGQWFDTVESYDPVADQWGTCPPLNRKNGSLAGATVGDKIYAVGGGNGVDCYSAVEMLDFEVGAWIPTLSMLQKRFALTAVELNGALYAVGGFDGKYYLRTAERFDPREHSWMKIDNMSTARGCPSLVVLNEKIFVLGGFDGNAMVSTVEIYDPRHGSWMNGDSMNHPRGFSAAAVARDSIYVFGGLRSGEEINDTVECYKEGRGWEMTNTNSACRRCFFSAISP